jgi:hypothetical protein
MLGLLASWSSSVCLGEEANVPVSSIASYKLHHGHVSATSLPDAAAQILTEFREEYREFYALKIPLTFDPLELPAVGLQRKIEFDLTGGTLAEAMEAAAERACCHNFLITPEGFSFAGLSKWTWGEHEVIHVKLYLSDAVLQRLNLNWSDPPKIFEESILKNWHIKLWSSLKVDSEGKNITFHLPSGADYHLLLMEEAVTETLIMNEAIAKHYSKDGK